MINRPDTRGQRVKRHARVRGKVSGTAERPRLCVFRSENNIYAQIIDDVAGNTLVAASSVEKDFEGSGSNKEAARKVGKLVAERALAMGTGARGLRGVMESFMRDVMFEAPYARGSKSTGSRVVTVTKDMVEKKAGKSGKQAV